MPEAALDVTFDAVVFPWRGPAPHHFVAVPPEIARELAELSGEVSYGWGMIPAAVRIGSSEFTTALWPREGGYVVPLKLAVRRTERIELDDRVTVRLQVGPGLG